MFWYIFNHMGNQREVISFKSQWFAYKIGHFKQKAWLSLNSGCCKPYCLSAQPSACGSLYRMCLYLGSSILRVWVLLWSSDLLHREDEAAAAAIQVMMTGHFYRQLLQFSSALRYRGCTQVGLCLLHSCCRVMRNTQTVSVDPKNSLLKWPVIIDIPVLCLPASWEGWVDGWGCLCGPS